MILRRFLQFGGLRLVWQYAKMGVLWSGGKALLHCAWHGQSLKTAYALVTQKVDDILLDRYQYVLDEALAKLGECKISEANRLESKSSEADGQKSDSQTRVPKVVWFSWLQGMEQAPDIVKVCLRSQRRHLMGYEFRIVDLTNYHNWVQLPQYVEEKFRKGLIPPALFSDLLRLALLKQYGGVWMDASVYCSGFGNEKLRERWEQIMGSELTLFRYFQRGRKEAVGLSTWFFAAIPQQPVISIVLDMLLAYWKDFDCTVDYYICHLFFGKVLSKFPDVWTAMPRANSNHSILLGSALGKDYQEAAWQDLIAHVSIHKMNYRKVGEAMENPNSYCNHIMNEGC